MRETFALFDTIYSAQIFGSEFNEKIAPSLIYIKQIHLFPRCPALLCNSIIEKDLSIDYELLKYLKLTFAFTSYPLSYSSFKLLETFATNLKDSSLEDLLSESEGEINRIQIEIAKCADYLTSPEISLDGSHSLIFKIKKDLLDGLDKVVWKSSVLL